MSVFIGFFIFFWISIAAKQILFWVYLWQLKEYHIGRFMDHFRTHKGKKILLNPFFIGKLVLLPFVLLHIFFAYIIVLIYLIEGLLFFLRIVKGQLLRPRLTLKTGLLLVFIGAVSLIWLWRSYLIKTTELSVACLLLFDIILPIIVSLIVLMFQPMFVILRNRILKQAKQKIADHKNLIVIGITGSYGKTSTKEFLSTILSLNYNVLATPDHKNSEIGIAQTILQDLRPDHQIFIAEMGSYKKGGIHLLCDMVRPGIGIVTGVNEQHLALFGSLENLLSAEGGQELVASLPHSGIIVINGDNKYCLDLYKKTEGINKKLYTIGKTTISSDIWTEDVVIDKDRVSFIARSKEGELAHINAKVIGKQQVQNLLGAMLVAKYLGMSFGDIAAACNYIQPKQASMTLKTGIHGITIIDSSHSSNPDGVVADLDYLHTFKGNKVIIMPCLIELGSKSAKIHRQLGKKIGQVCNLAIITTKDKFKEIENGAKEAGIPEDNVVLCDKPKEIMNYITTYCKEGDAILLEGRVSQEILRLLVKEKPSI